MSIPNTITRLIEQQKEHTLLHFILRIILKNNPIPNTIMESKIEIINILKITI
jgi:hypothetical protein